MTKENDQRNLNWIHKSLLGELEAKLSNDTWSLFGVCQRKAAELWRPVGAPLRPQAHLHTSVPMATPSSGGYPRANLRGVLEQPMFFLYVFVQSLLSII